MREVVHGGVGLTSLTQTIVRKDELVTENPYARTTPPPEGTIAAPQPTTALLPAPARALLGTGETFATWWPELLSGIFGFFGLVSAGCAWGTGGLIVGGLLFVAALLWRRAPGWALGLVWLVGLFQLLFVVPPLISDLIIALVSFGAARYGSRMVLWISGGSLVASVLPALLGGLILAREGLGPGAFWWPTRDGGLFASPAFLFLLGMLIWLAFVSAPWLIGFTLRAQREQRTARTQADVAVAAHQVAARDAEQAHQIAALKESQARLARDVHDVVGHSLAVILAQAESAQFLPEEDLAARDQVLGNIATSARQSLQDVRAVLGRTHDGQTATTMAAGTVSLDRLIDGVRSAGNDVRTSTEGSPQPLPPDLESVAYRVLQEMLTNALKHGTRGGPVWVEQHWEGDLRLEVRNVIADVTPGNSDPKSDETAPLNGLTNGPDSAGGAGRSGTGETPGGETAGGETAGGDTAVGLGLAGMRSRLEAVGGRLDVRRRHDDQLGPTFTATAWMPIRAGG